MGQALYRARGSWHAISCIFIAGCELEWETDKSIGFGSLKSTQKSKELVREMAKVASISNAFSLVFLFCPLRQAEVR